MIPWQFETYVSASGRNDVQKTVDGYDPYGRQSFSRAVAHLAVSPKSQWHEPHGKKLKNENPIYEIRYKAFKRQERALGYFEDSTSSFIIVLTCHHKGRVYKPPKAFEIAHRRIKEIQSGSAKTVPLQVDREDFPPHDEKPR